MVMMLGSCSDFLDVEPKDKILGENVYNSELSINNVVNGIYLNLADKNLYGQQLSMDAVEILGQQYNTANPHVKEKIGSYSYGENNVKSVFSAIWEKSYMTILTVNKFIVDIDENPNVISTEKSDILKGEAYAIRATLHFDLLRLYGPIYAVNPLDKSIPYYTEPQVKASPILPGTQVIDKVLADLDMSLELLANDPVLTLGPNGASPFQGDTFYANRGQRLNYFAVKALKARVLLYAGYKEEAFAVANEVINAGTAFFPWTTLSEATDVSSPDRIFSKEIYFFFFFSQLYATQARLFDYSLISVAIYAPIAERSNTLFESDNDYRNLPTWKIPPANHAFKTFFKYADVNDKLKRFRFLQPIVKKAEMYLIAAECAPDNTTAFTYLNTLRNNRGLIDLDETADRDNEIWNEYKREFYGEGQLFFFYKRLNWTDIPDGNSDWWIPMSPSTYVVPLPDLEKIYNN